jgi:hypothetical protein
MTQTLLARPETTPGAFSPAPAPTASAIPAPRSATRQIIEKIKSAPWMLLFLAPIGAAPLYVSFDTASYGFGMVIACVPILAAAAFLLTGILTCVFFLDED